MCESRFRVHLNVSTRTFSHVFVSDCIALQPDSFSVLVQPSFGTEVRLKTVAKFSTADHSGSLQSQQVTGLV
ncbi:hypothetical protein ABBQ32_011032 [Trebouxia sp. C0010 RCD-2024]